MIAIGLLAVGGQTTRGQSAGIPTHAHAFLEMRRKTRGRQVPLTFGTDAFGLFLEGGHAHGRGDGLTEHVHARIGVGGGFTRRVFADAFQHAKQTHLGSPDFERTVCQDNDYRGV